MKKIKKLLSEHSAEILPDKHIKDNIKRQLGYEEKEVSLSYAHGGEKTVKENRNKLIALCASVFAVLLALCILLPVFCINRKPLSFPLRAEINSRILPTPIPFMLTAPLP